MFIQKMMILRSQSRSVDDGIMKKKRGRCPVDSKLVEPTTKKPKTVPTTNKPKANPNASKKKKARNLEPESVSVDMRKLSTDPNMARAMARDLKDARRYLKQIDESDGFDVDEDALPKSLTNMFWNLGPADSVHFKRRNLNIDTFCEAAIRTYNRDNKLKDKFTFHSFSHANLSATSYITYHITFYAANAAGIKHVFQASVLDRVRFNRGTNRHLPDVKFCRIKGT